MKILCLGNVATGKTCIIRRYVNNEFSHQYRTTIGVDFMLKDVNINGKAIKVQFWDLGMYHIPVKICVYDRYSNHTNS